MTSPIVFRSLCVLALLALGVASGCKEGFGECDPLALENPCSPGDGYARFCSVPDGNTCVNVCEGADILGGDSCAEDRQCDSSLTCDNDRVAVSTCTCVLACPSVGADPESVQTGGACSQTVDCAQGLSCDNEMVGVSSCTCIGPGSTCNDLYGDLAGYELCQLTETTCTFYRNDQSGDGMSCAEICGGLECKAYNEGEPTVCDVGSEVPCDELQHDAVCECRG